MTVSLKQRSGYDGTENGGTIVSTDFIGKNLHWLAERSHIEYAIDHGLNILEQKGKAVQKKLDSQQPTKLTLTGPPLVDSDGDGINDNFDSCPYAFNPQNADGCPSPEIILGGSTIVDSDGDGINDNFDSCPHNFNPQNADGCPDTVLKPKQQKEFCFLFWCWSW